MLKLKYKNRIHRDKFSLRNLRYVLTDQLVRAVPGLQKRWLFPVESTPMRDAASSAESFPARSITETPPEANAQYLQRPVPIEAVQRVYTFHNVIVTGQSGALIKDGRLLAMRPKPNWPIALRPRRYKLTPLPGDGLYYVMMPPVPAVGHIFHWLFDYVVPLMTWLESRREAEPVQLIVNGKLSEVQRRCLEVLAENYGLAAPIGLPQNEAFAVSRVAVSVLEPHTPGVVHAPAGIAALKMLAEKLSGVSPGPDAKRRLYISRNDAKARRVANEAELAPVLAAHGFETVILKGMPLARQVRLFQEAEMVVAPHGAGLTNIAWCRPGTKIIEFFPSPHGPFGKPRNATADYWIIALLKALDYRAFEAGPSLNRHNAFNIAPGQLAQALKDAE
jgi:hypothetical protein